MKIAINGSCLLHPTKTGVELYVASLLEEIKNIPNQEDFEFIVYYPATGELDSDWLSKFPKNWQFKAVNWPFKFLWTQLALYWQLRKDKADLLFVPAHVIPALYRGRTVMTVHDLAFKYFTDAYSPRELKYQDWAIKSAKRKKTSFIVPSKTTRDDLLKFYNIAEDKIAKVYHGFAAQSLQASKEEISDIRQKYNLSDRKYFISIGRVENKKNSLGAIRAFEKLCEDNNISNIDFVLVGKGGFGYENILAAVEQSKYKNNIHLLGYLPNKDVAALFSGAHAFLFPTFYEGFGFPILEAMSVGVPVITSNYGVMEEIAQEAALLIDPNKTEEIVRAMNKLLLDDESRDYYIQAGLKKYKEFTWERTANETLEAFRKFIKK